MSSFKKCVLNPDFRPCVRGFCWKPKFPRLLATGSKSPDESTRRTRHNNTSLLLDAFASTLLLYMLFILQFLLSYGLITASSYLALMYILYIVSTELLSILAPVFFSVWSLLFFQFWSRVPLDHKYRVDVTMFEVWKNGRNDKSQNEN